MSRRLPSLPALRAFEAAARHLSFTKAAGELSVTPAAVSHQVRTLEEELGVRLFWRTSRAVRLTRAGESLRTGVGEGLGVIADAVDQIRGDDGRRTLTVTSSPSFAAKWLVPRLERYRQLCPDVDVRIDVSERLVDFAREDADIGIRFGSGSYPGLRADRLSDEAVFPVCSPKLLQGEHPLRHPRDLEHHTLIHDEWRAQDGTWPDWRTWLVAAGVEGIDLTRGLRISLYSLGVQAAVEGQGVVLGNTSLVADDLRSGRLVRPFELAIKVPFAYHVVSPRSTAELPLVRTFREWLLAEARQSIADPASAALITTI
jgi:LysR family transcriptional regulator, glycine cleavage system transcriptional activator